MRSSFFVQPLNDPFGDPAFFVRVAHRREALLFDCGNLHSLNVRDLLKVQALFISHAHIDHLAGFDQLLRALLYRATPLHIYGPPGIIERMTHRLAGYTWNLVRGYPLRIHVSDCTDQGVVRSVQLTASSGFHPQPMDPPLGKGPWIHESRHYRVSCRALAHGDILSMGYALQEKIHVAIHGDALDARGYRPGPWLTHFKDLVRDQVPDATLLEIPLLSGGTKICSLGDLKSHMAHCETGMKVVYVTDVSPTQANMDQIAALAVDAHLLIIEAVFAQEDWKLACERNHLTAQAAGCIARRAGARKLLLFHHSPRYQHQPQRLHDEAMAAFKAR